MWLWLRLLLFDDDDDDVDAVFFVVIVVADVVVVVVVAAVVVCFRTEVPTRVEGPTKHDPTNHTNLAQTGRRRRALHIIPEMEVLVPPSEAPSP